MEEIFTSWFNLNFKKSEYEEEYQNIKLGIIRKYTKIFTLCLFICHCLVALEISFFFSEYSKNAFKAIMVTSYFILFCYFIMGFMEIFTDNIFIIKLVNYLNYFFIFFLIMNCSYPLLQFLKLSVLYTYIILYVEIVIRMIWNLLGVLNFKETLIINLMHIVLLWSIFTPLAEPNLFFSQLIMFLVYSLNLILVIGISYVLEKQQRNAYFFYYQANQKAIWFRNVVDNMNTGFLSIKGEEVTFVNKYLADKLELATKEKPTEAVSQNINQETKLIINKKEEQKFNRSKYNVNTILSTILYNLNPETISIKYILIILADEAISNIIKEIKNEKQLHTEEGDQNVPITTKNFLNLLINSLSKISSVSNFIFIGEQIILTEDDTEINFEVYCRINKLPEGAELEFIFNDISRSKINENLKAELKYKSQFLSKVAHEFKNPLICMEELIQQLDSNPEFQDNIVLNDFKSKMKQIKSMSNYLLVLIKDLDYFSKSQIEDSIKFEDNETKIDNLIDFCSDITDLLIIKSNKSDQIQFKAQKEIGVPDIIMTDEWKLKQILVNLISNAVKFTHFGEIILQISMLDEHFIKFVIKDTGVGIKPEQQEKLLQPFKKGSNLNNEILAGLGLSIVLELTKKFGGLIEFNSEFRKGSSFWFTIPFKQKEESVINSIEDSPNEEEEEIHLRIKNKYIKSEIESSETKRIDLNFNKSILLLNPQNAELNLNEEENLITIPNQEIKKDKFIFSIEDLFSKDIELLKTQSENIKLVNVIIADDERMTRQSTVRILKEAAKDLAINLNIIEADDGIESLYIYYKCFIQGIKIAMIFSDETMNYMNGSKSAKIIEEIEENKNMPVIPFCLVTAYENFGQFKSIKKVLTKPVTKSIIQEMYKAYILAN